MKYSEAMLEKRKQITAFHRANAEKDLDIEYSDSELMGGDDIKERYYFFPFILYYYFNI